jgi:hypothetical protein
LHVGVIAPQGGEVRHVVGVGDDEGGGVHGLLRRGTLGEWEFRSGFGVVDGGAFDG